MYVFRSRFIRLKILSMDIKTIVPTEYHEVLQYLEWKAAMEEEKMIKKNIAKIHVEKLPHKKTIGINWIYKNKTIFVSKYKAKNCRERLFLVVQHLLQ